MIERISVAGTDWKRRRKSLAKENQNGKVKKAVVKRKEKAAK